MGYGLLLLVTGGKNTSPLPVLGWLVGLDIASDALLLPVVAVVGALLSRWLPVRVRPPVQAGLVVAAALGVVAVPVLNGAGRDPDNPSLLPLDYVHSIGVALVCVLVVTLIAVAVRLARPRTLIATPHDPPPQDPADPEA